MGGSSPSLSIEESILGVVDAAGKCRGLPGFAYVNSLGETLPWYVRMLLSSRSRRTRIARQWVVVTVKFATPLLASSFSPLKTLAPFSETPPT
jgi:hypothetical protein